MGACAVSNIKSIAAEFKGDTEPQDTNSYRGLPLPEKTFNVKISNIKIKGLATYTQDQVSITLNMPNFPEIKMGKRNVEDGVVRWNDKPQKLQLKCNEYQLRKEWLVVSLLYSDIKISELKINLYKIAAGPAHLTFPMILSNKQQCRLSLDVHFSEIISISIETVLTEVTLDASRPGQLFNFTIRTITHSQKDQQQSQPSYPQKQTVQHFDVKQRKSNIQQSNKIIWLNKKQNPLPKMQRKVVSAELSQSSIQFMLWECNDLEVQEDDVLTGQCYVSFNKASSKDPIEGSRNNRPTFLYRALVSQKLWLSGKCIGKIRMQLIIQIDQYIKQNLMYVRTQFGPQLSTPIFDTTKQRVQCPQIIQLQKLQTLIQNGLIKMQSFKRTDTLKIQDIRVKVLGLLLKSLNILESSKKQSIRFYIYKSQKDLLNGQQCLLDIGVNTLSRLQGDENLILKQYCWKILIAIIQRGQLSLKFTCFTEEQKVAIQEKSNKKFIKQKFQFSIKYQQFLYNALKSALKSMESKNLQTVQRKFVECYCAFCYLRIPQFREQLLRAINKNTDKAIQQWRGTQFGLQDETDIKSKRQSDPDFSVLYDWQKNFHNVISSDSRSQHNLQELKQTLNVTGWRQRMQKRGVAFFLFLDYWIQYIQIAAIITHNLKWYILPGYNKLVKAILSQMQLRKITQYPDSLKQVSTKMLSNQKLLNVFISIILRKVNLMEHNSVIAGLGIISAYLKFLNSINRRIPTTFNYSNFLDSLKLIITHEHSFSAAVCLKLIYDYYSMFAAQFRRQMSLFLMGKVFFRMFLSWSFNIRVVFHHLLLFRLVLQSNRLPSQKRAIEHGTNSQIKRRYLLLMNILQNVKQRRQQDQCDNFRINYEKEYFKKMRKKLQQGRKVIPKSQNLIDQAVKRKNTIKGAKYSIKQLSKPTQTLRAHSQLIDSVHVNYSKFGGQETHSIMNDFTEQSQTEQQLRIRKKIQPENEIPELPMQLLQYTKQALGEFRDIQQKFDKFYSGNVDHNVVPSLSIKLPTDEGQFRVLEPQDW